MRHSNPKDLVAGAALILIGGSFFVGSYAYDIGTVTHMGPGYLPNLLGLITMAVGAGIGITALRSAGQIPRIVWRPMAAVLSGLLVFAFLVELTGLIPAILCTVGVSAFGDRAVRPARVLLLAIVTAIGSWIIFILGLQLPIAAIKGII